MINIKQKYAKNVVKYFNHLIKNTIFKDKNKTNDNFKISNFNKYLIALISILFFYLFYLSIPTIYEKTWVQNTIEKKLFEDFKIRFSTSSNITYNILPSPHFIIKDSKIHRDTVGKISPISELKNLKVFIIQNNFFNKNNLSIKEIVIDNANFSLNKGDFDFLNKLSNRKFSNKKIKINNSNIFFKDSLNETIALIKISNAILFHDNIKLLNFFKLNGEIFNIPFTFNLNKESFSSGSKEVTIIAKPLKLDMINKSVKKSNNIIEGKNIISISNSKILSNYKIKEDLIYFESGTSKFNESGISYKGKLSVKPFDLKLDVKIENTKLSDFKRVNYNIIKFIKTRLLFNENITANISINTNLKKHNKIFNSATLFFNAANGSININNSKLINKKLGVLEVINSNLFFKNNNIILNTSFKIDIKNQGNLFSFLQTPKQARKAIDNIFINLDYDILTGKIILNSIKINGLAGTLEIRSIIEDFNDENILYNLNKTKLMLNKLLDVYDG